MALLWHDGFNLQDADDVKLFYDSLAGGVNCGNTQPRTGQSYFRAFASGTVDIRKNISPGSTTLIIGFGFRIDSGSSATETTIFEVGESAITHLTLRLVSSTGLIRLYDGAGSMLAEGATVFPIGQGANDWRFVELKVTLADSGSYELKIENAVEFSGSADLNNGGTGVATYVAMRNTNGSVFAAWDDLYVLDNTGSDLNDYLTSSFKIESLFVTAAGDLAQWTPSAGSNYQNVDENTASGHDGDTTYNSAGSTGLIDAHNCADLTGSPSTILAVCGGMIARNDDVGSSAVKIGVRSSGVASTETERTLQPAYDGYHGDYQKLDPNTGSAWALSAVNAAQVQYERTT
ncbi:MAG: hypothetical protein KDG50_07095 [Chromatiales bacterium]|nr:hypothetical protein [Chromatiales bacterium]